MKKLDYSLSRLASGIAILILILSISDSCTKPGSYEDTPQPPPPPPAFRVNIGGSFSPVELKISAGDMVTWINNSPEIESVTSDDGLFESILRSHESYSFKFVSTGTYTYYSRLHAGMIGKVVVN